MNNYHIKLLKILAILFLLPSFIVGVLLFTINPCWSDPPIKFFLCTASFQESLFSVSQYTLVLGVIILIGVLWLEKKNKKLN